MSVLFCDSNCELWFDEVERLGLKFISMPYTLEDTEYFYDLGKNTDFDFWYKSVRNGAKCITSALNPEMYDEIFRPYFEKGEDISGRILLLVIVVNQTDIVLLDVIEGLREKMS